MRTLNEMAADMEDAVQTENVPRMRELADEMGLVRTPVARSYEAVARGKIAMHMGQLDEAEKQFSAAVELNRTLNDPERHSLGLFHLGHVLLVTHQFDKAVEALTESIAVGETTSMESLVARSRAALGAVFANVDRFEEALTQLDKAQEIHQRLGELPGVAVCLANTANIQSMMGLGQESIESYDRAFAVYQELGDRAGMGGVRANTAIVYTQQGNYAEALVLLNQSTSLYQEINYTDGLLRVKSSLASVYMELGEYHEAERLQRELLAATTDTGRSFSKALARNSLGILFGLMGRHEEAVTYLEEALEGIRHQQGDQELARMRCNLGIAYMHTDRIQEAEELLVLADGATIRDPRIQIEREELRGRILISKGALQEAKTLLGSARALAEQHDLQREQLDMIELLQHIASEERDFDMYKQLTEALIRKNDALRGERVSNRVAALDRQRQQEVESVERDRERSILYRTLPPEIAAKAVRGEDVSGDLHEHATVLFLDTVDFTSHAMQMDPKELTRLLGVVFRHFDAICAKHNVTKIKTIGDAYLAVAFDGAESAEHRAANAAVEMIRSEFFWPTTTATATVNSNSNRMQFRIGLHSGPLVAGVIGTDRLQYDVWGDAVNTASRMESTGEAGRIQVSSEFHEQLSSRYTPSHSLERGASEGGGVRFWTTERGTIDIKGKGSMTTYWLEGG